MKHTWHIVDEGGERVEVTLTCKFDEVIDAPLTLQYLTDLVNNAQNADECVSNTNRMPGMTTLTCEFNVIDHSQGDQYLYVSVDAEVPTQAGEWDNREQVADVFDGIREHLIGSPSEFSLDEGVRLWVDGDLMA